MGSTLTPSKKSDAQLFQSIFLIVGLGTLTVATNFLDPINLPKLIAITLPLPWLILYSLRVMDFSRGFSAIREDRFRIMFSVSLVSLLLLLALSPAPFERRFFGTWGRNNGILTALVSILLSWATYECVKRNADIVKIAKYSLYILIPTGLYGLLQVADQDPIAWSSGSMKIFATFGNTNFASAAWGLAAMLSLALLIFDRDSTKIRVTGKASFYATCFFGFIFLSYMTKSIQGLFAIVAFSSLLLISKLLSLRSLFGKILAGLVAGLGALVAQSIFFSGPLTNVISSAGSLGFRKIYWNIGLRIFAEKPVFGVGVDSYGDYYRTVRSAEMAKTTSIDLVVNNAHNTFIQTLATMGILGFIALILPVIVTLILGVRKYISGEYHINSAFFAMFVALWLMASFSIDNISITLWNWLFLGASLGISAGIRKDIPETISSSSKKQRQANPNTLYDFGRIMAGASSIVILFFMWQGASADRNIAKVLRTPVSFAQPETIDAQLIRLGDISRLRVLDPQHYYMLSKSLVELQQVPQSVEYLLKGVTDFPRDFGLWDSLAYSLENQGQITQAIEARKKQLELDPQHARVWSYLARDYVQIGDLENAKMAAKKSIENFSIFAPSDQESIRNFLREFNLI